MLKPDSSTDYSADIATALGTEGGHLSIGRGFTLHFRDGAMLSGYDCKAIKTQYIAAGLPVIDSPMYSVRHHCAPDAARTAGRAVGREPGPSPWHGLSYAPLHAVAVRYADAGEEVWNFPSVGTMPRLAERRTAS